MKPTDEQIRTEAKSYSKQNVDQANNIRVTKLQAFAETDFIAGAKWALSQLSEHVQEFHKLEDDWVSVDERLPEDDRNVIVFQDNKYISFGWLLRKETWKGSISDETIDVTHWQPLPKPPIKE